MATFRFRLDRVLDWRRKSFELALARQESLRLECRRIEEALLACRSRMALRVEPVTTGLELAAFQRYLSRLQSESSRLEDRYKITMGLLHAQTERVIEANRAVKMLECLRDKRLVEWNAELDKELELLAADVASNRWLAKSTPPAPED